MQNQLESSSIHLFEVNGALSVQIEQNKRNKTQLHHLQSEISERNFGYEKEIVDLQNIQFNTLNKLRDLHTTANSLESDVATILGHFPTAGKGTSSQRTGRRRESDLSSFQ